MFKDITKISTIALSLVGLILLIYGWTDRTMLSLGQTLMVVGAIFLVGGLVTYQLNKIAHRLGFSVSILRDIDASLSVPSPAPQNEQDSFIPPKTTAFHMDSDADFKLALEKSASQIIPIAAPAAVIAPMFVPRSLPTPVEMKIEEPVSAPVNLEAKRDYYNDLASYLETKPLETKPVALSAAPIVTAEPLPEVNVPEVSAPPSAYTQKLTELASDFPELDALLKRELKIEPEPIVEPEPVEAPPLPAIIREGQISGIPFKLYSDGTIDAQFSNGSHRFASIAEFKNYVEGA